LERIVAAPRAGRRSGLSASLRRWRGGERGDRYEDGRGESSGAHADDYTGAMRRTDWIAPIVAASVWLQPGGTPTTVPRAWDDAELASFELPLVNPERSARHIDPDFYY